MSLILLVIGVVLYATSRFSFGGVRTQGRHVRAAGMMLIFPAVFTFVLSFVGGMMFAANASALMTLFSVMAAFEIISMVVGVAVAYLLIANPQNAPRLPGILGDIQRERRNQPPAQRVESTPQPPAREQFPSVLTVAQAARYMQMSETQIVHLIDTGKLAAARINYTYRIARSNLDDLLSDREAAPGA